VKSIEEFNDLVATMTVSGEVRVAETIRKLRGFDKPIQFVSHS
jgi:hypothetical protein